MGLKLKTIFEALLKEQNPVVDPMQQQGMNSVPLVPPDQMQQQQMAQQEDPYSVVELPSVNMTVSIFPSEHKLLFSPMDHGAYTNKIRTYVNMLKQQFKIIDSNAVGYGKFELVLDPREDFNAVLQTLSQLANLDTQS